MEMRTKTVDVVTAKVRGFIESNALHLPANYSTENALKSAWLILQTTLDRNKKPVLEVCEGSSIANALLDMIVQALNPAKKQCYFIAYGKQLVCQRSYFGSMAVAKMFAGVKDVFAQVVWEGDVLEYGINAGNKTVTKHEQKLANVGKNPQGAYCVLVLEDGQRYTDIMTMEQIEAAWSKSKMDAKKSTSTHQQFQEEMIRKTVINRACKKFINTSSDSGLLLEHFNRGGQIATEAEFEEEVAENANQALIDVQTEVLAEDAGAPEGPNSEGSGGFKLESESTGKVYCPESDGKIEKSHCQTKCTMLDGCPSWD
jgi:recombination protein RecT